MYLLTEVHLNGNIEGAGGGPLYQPRYSTQTVWFHRGRTQSSSSAGQPAFSQNCMFDCPFLRIGTTYVF